MFLACYVPCEVKVCLLLSMDRGVKGENLSKKNYLDLRPMC